ncbi:alkaline phosphatase [Pedobacter cryoconitis]|uniref:Alkaline phosphatase n=1 Tax=Pedobacter cryoconitis TaxID=188932 RepID=A0A7X0ML63_9SPHI|nr:alkaline phosphatase [Pedobacter cryoconitis]MBB6502771.1 alkaline phosphatase [Pedobacter cryoconitis]
MKKLFRYSFLGLLLLTIDSQAQQSLSANAGHSHNDYKQNIPLLRAYYAGMGSIEADVFLKEGQLFVAHELKEIKPGATLVKEYLEPLYKLYKQNGNHPYADPKLKLQLVIDVKEDYQHVLPQLLKELKPFQDMVNRPTNPDAVSIVISGDMPVPEKFKDYPEIISFDGRPTTVYTDEQLERIAMISDELTHYTVWNGKGTPTKIDELKLKAVIDAAHQKNKPFRFWATQDSPNTWVELEKFGVDWINTDAPEKLRDFYLRKDKLTYTNPVAYPVYQPSYKTDGADKKVKNIILLIGDGMGLAQIHAGWIANHGNLNITMIRNSGFSQTAAANSGNTDSAAGGSAIAMGEKTNNRYIGMGTDDKKRTNLVDTLATYGLKSGIISVGDITDATPAVFYAHQLDRSFSEAIAKDFLDSHVDILVGSNQKSFLQNPDADLMRKLENKGYTLSKSMTDFKQKTSGKQLVLLPDSATRPVKDGRGNMLAESLKKTMQLLSTNKKGFFIMTEGAQIDYGGHVNDLKYVVTELHDFDKTVGEALRFADQDGETLVLITADHETGGLTLLDASASEGRIQGEFSTNDHTNIMVPVYAYGPHSSDFTGTYANNELFKKILRLVTSK